MKINVESGDITQHEAKVIIVNLFQGVKSPGGATGAVDAALEGGITALISEGEIKGKGGEALLVHTLGRMPSPRVIIAGLGKQDSFDLNVIRNLMGTALRRARMTGAKTVATIVHGAGIAGLETADCAQAIAEGALMGEYRFRKYKSVDDPSFSEIATLTIVEADKRTKKTLGLLGKGITFDSGGISIKPAGGMEAMKGDMSGAAAVIATMWALGKLKPRINVTGIVPTAENMPSGSAQRPGDVVRAMNGKTIEVINTDAEGRLILADAICYARQEKLSPIVDVATLTGAMMIALGNRATGFFATDDALADQITSAGEKSGELMWRFPLIAEYREDLKSTIADIKNTGVRGGGAISAAKFLHFFAEDTPWAHIDMAGTDESPKDRGLWVKGSTGIPTRTLINFVLARAPRR